MRGSLQQALVQAAIAIAREEGLGALTLRGAARRVGVSTAAVYHHFTDRLMLLAVVAQDVFERFGEALRRASVGEADVREGILRVGVAWTEFALAHRAEYRLMFGPELSEQLERVGEHGERTDAAPRAARREGRGVRHARGAEARRPARRHAAPGPSR